MVSLKKEFLLVFVALSLSLVGSTQVLAEIGSGKVSAKSSDIDISIFGHLKVFPHFISDPDFNDDDTPYDFLLSEAGTLDNDTVSVAHEFRLGFLGKGNNWSFMSILESNFVFDKNNTDRGARAGEPLDSGMTGEDFGIEKLEFTYNFSDYGFPVTLETGWNTKHLDWETGALCYLDDHPYVGLKGNFNDISWELLSAFVYDNPGTSPVGSDDADALDWEIYTLKFSMPVATMKVAPFYAYSDNQARESKVSYFGIETYGKIGILSPKAEIVYATGDRDDLPVGGGDIEDADVEAFAAFGYLEANLEPSINPYLGGYYIQGDNDASDDDIEAFNAITNAAQYTHTFGMTNGFMYQYVPVIGTHIYSNSPSMLGKNSGYGGISNSASAESPGMYSFGLGCKGAVGDLTYKTQLQKIYLEETGALEEVTGVSDIDDVLGWQYDLLLTYQFSDHFSIGNCISIFEPGDAVEDLRGDDYDETAIMDTIEMKWKF